MLQRAARRDGATPSAVERQPPTVTDDDSDRDNSHRTSRTFDPRFSAIRSARQFASAWLAEHHVAWLEQAVLLAVSELATNAIRHTRESFTVEMRIMTGLVRIDVIDSSPQARPLPPALPTDTYEGGRGLLLVSTLATRWGVDLATDRKSVWCEFDFSDSSPTS